MLLKYIIKILKSAEEVEKVQEFWEQMQCHPDGDIDIFLHNLHAAEKQVSPYVILILLRDEPRAMMAGLIERRRIDLSIGYATLRGPELRILTVLPGRILAVDNHEYAHLFLQKLIAALDRKEADLVDLQYIDCDSCLFKLAHTYPEFRSRVANPQAELRWRTVLPGTSDELFQNIDSNQRHEFLRKERRIYEKYPGKITFRCYENHDSVARVCDDMEQIAKKSFHRILGMEFRNDSQTTDDIATYARRGWLRVYLLYIGERPCAFCLGILYRHILYMQYAGYDLSYRDCSPGIVLCWRMLKDVYKGEDNIKEIDWGQGKARFSKHLGNHCIREASVYLFPRTIRGFSMRVAIKLFIQATVLFKRALVKLGLKDKVMSGWRHKLIAKKIGVNLK